jgi:hypothetical protein
VGSIRNLKFADARMPQTKLCHKTKDEHPAYRFLHPWEAPRFFVPLKADKINNWYCDSCCHYAAVCRVCFGWCGGEAPYPGVYYLDRCGCTDEQRGILIVSYCCPGGQYGGSPTSDRHGFCVHCVYCGEFGSTDSQFVFIQGLPVCYDCAHRKHQISRNAIDDLSESLRKQNW